MGFCSLPKGSVQNAFDSVTHCGQEDCPDITAGPRAYPANDELRGQSVAPDGESVGQILHVFQPSRRQVRLVQTNEPCSWYLSVSMRSQDVGEDEDNLAVPICSSQ